MKWSWLFVMTALLGIAAFVAYGCGQDKLGLPAGPGNGVGPGQDGPCTDGATRDCHRLLGEHDGIRMCANGTQECKGGTWSTCGGTNNSISSLALPPGARFLGGGAAPGSGGKLTPLSLSPPSPDAGICIANPCDPYCVGFDECLGDAACALTTEAGPPPNFDGNPGNGGIPGGDLGNLFNDATYGTAVDDCRPFPMFSHCQADTFCFVDRDKFILGDDIGNEVTPTPTPTNYKNCTHFSGGNHYTAAACPGVNLTVQPGCKATGSIPSGVAAGNDVIGVCNRGSAAFAGAAGVGITLTNAAGSGLPRDVPPSACFTSVTPDCTVTLPALAPGECTGVDLTASACGPQSGLKYYSINQNSAVAECAFDSAFLQTPQAAQLGCADNWAAQDLSVAPACTGSGTAPSTANFSETYTAVCVNPSTVPQWTLFTYDTGGATTAFSNTSGSGEVIVKASTAPLLDGGPGTFSTPVIVADACDSTKTNCLAIPPQGDPGQCSMTGPATCPPVPSPLPPAGPCCPKSLFNTLGTTAANDAVLQLDFIISTTPDGLLAPTVQSWQVAYSCVPAK